MPQLQGSNESYPDSPELDEDKLILITRGRYTGRSEAALLDYRRFGNDYLVVACNDPDQGKPDWYLNLEQEPLVQVEIGGACFYARASAPAGQTRLHLLPAVASITPRADRSVLRKTTAILLSPTD